MVHKVKYSLARVNKVLRVQNVLIKAVFFQSAREVTLGYLGVSKPGEHEPPNHTPALPLGMPGPKVTGGISRVTMVTRGLQVTRILRDYSMAGFQSW